MSVFWKRFILLAGIVSNAVVLVLLFVTINLAFGIAGAPAKDGNVVTRILELNTNAFVPIAIALNLVALFVCSREPKLKRTSLLNHLILIVLIGGDISFGHWFFAVPLEGVLKFSERIWWL